MIPFRELPNLTVHIDKVIYMPHLDAPEDRPFPFVYYLTIENQSDETVTIKGRKWVVISMAGDTVVVEGDGVVGKCPRLEPGERFSYNSYHVIGSDSVAEGAFFGINEQGEPVMTRIPRFAMTVPE